MKAELYTNCSLLRIPVKAGQTDYQFPQNVDWSERKIDRVVICAPQTACVDPVDGVTPVLTVGDLTDCYVTMYDADNRELMHDAAAEQILHLNNHPLYVNAKLNLSLCRVSFTSAPGADGVLLLYVFYQTRTEDYFEQPRKSVSVLFPLAADQEISLREIINTYAHALPDTIKGISFWGAAANPAWLTLRDYKLTYQMANIHSEMARPDMNGGTAYDTQAFPFWLNDLDIDFDYSNIREAAGQSSTQLITFYY